jgi:hypothetical protein
VKVIERLILMRLPKSRPSQTTWFTVGGAEGYMMAGPYTTMVWVRCSSSLVSRARRWPG